MTYLDMSTVEARRTTQLPKFGCQEYGNRLPTSRMLKLSGRWHRVYAICWGTGATCYIRKGGVPHYIATGDI